MGNSRKNGEVNPVKEHEATIEEMLVHPSFIERKLKVLNEIDNKALARGLAERIMSNKGE